MKKFKFFGMMAVAAMAVSCSSDDVVQQVQEDNAIQFSTYLGNAAQSRATIADNDALKANGFGVFAYYTGQDAWADADKTTPNFMDNQQVTWDGSASAWTYSPIKYWPNNPGDKVSFFAYAPYNGSGITTTTGSSEIEFAVNSEVLQQVDLLYAEQDNNTVDVTKQNIGDNVHFTFKHALSAIALQVEAVNDKVNNDATGEVDDAVVGDDDIADGTTIAVQSVEITGDFTNVGKLNTYTNAWSPVESLTRTYTFDADEFVATVAADVPDEKTQLSNEDAYLMIIPQNVESMTVKVVYTVTTADGNLSTGSSVITNTITSDPFEITLEQNKKYNLCLHLGMTSVKLSAEVTDWEDGGDVVVNVPINTAN